MLRPCVQVLSSAPAHHRRLSRQSRGREEREEETVMTLTLECSQVLPRCLFLGPAGAEQPSKGKEEAPPCYAVSQWAPLGGNHLLHRRVRTQPRDKEANENATLLHVGKGCAQRSRGRRNRMTPGLSGRTVLWTEGNASTHKICKTVTSQPTGGQHHGGWPGQALCSGHTLEAASPPQAQRKARDTPNMK